MKKFVWLLIAIFALNLTALAETETQQETQTQQEEQVQQETLSYEDYYFLNNIGMLDGAGVSFDSLKAPITKAEFVSLAIKLAVKTPENVTDAFFADVPNGGNAAKAVYAAAARGFISKSQNFNPDSTITVEQADKMVVSALGYGEYAELDGGWPTGYLMQATNLRLNSGVKSSAELTKYDALHIIRNAFETDIMKLVQVGDNKDYKSAEGKTPLTEIYDIYKIKGIIAENGITGIKTTVSGDKADRVKINGTVYFAGATNACDYIGQNVIAYYRDNKGDTLTLVHAQPDEERNKVVAVMSDQIKSYSSNIFKYDEDGKAKTLRTTPALSLIYNGKRLTTYTNDNILIPTGEITFIDNNADNIFDVAISYNYECYYVEALNATSYTVIDGKSDVTTTKKLTLDPDDKTVRIFDESGAISDFGAISNDTVITAYTSADDSYVEVYTYGSSLETVIQAVSYENGKRTILTDKKEYIVENSFKGDINIGEKAYIYLNAYGHVAYIDAEASDLNPAYLINYLRTSNISEIREIKVLTGDGDLKIFELADKMKINDVIMDASNEDVLWGEKRKPILYKINKDGLVTYVYTPQDGSDTTPELCKVYADSDINNDGIPDTTVYYRTSDGMFIVPQEISNNVYPHFCTATGAVFFGVPNDQTTAKDEDYVIYDTGNRNEGLPFASVNMYSFKNTGLVGICEVFYNAGDDSRVSWGDTSYAVVSNPMTVLNEDGETVEKFTNLTNGNEMYIDKDADIDVHEGDIMLLTINKSSGNVEFAKKLYCRAEDKAFTVTPGSHGRAGFKGTITKIEQGTFVMKTETGETMTLRIRGTIFDMINKRKPVSSSATALSVGNEIAVYLSEGCPMCIMLLK